MKLQQCLAASLCLTGTAAINLTVSSSGGNASSPLMYGLMFEDINNAGDGGVYAELIKNRAFQSSPAFPATLIPWEGVGSTVISLNNASVPLSSALPVSLHVTGNSSTLGISNPGYWGIDVRPQTYTGSFYVLGDYHGFFTASLVSDISNKTLATTKIHSKSVSGAWAQHNYTLIPTAAASNSNNSLVITFNSLGLGAAGSLDFNLISLFPPTYNDRPNGMRPDLMKAMKNLNPSFLRIPGGNNLEGLNPPYRWVWNQTIGPLKDRPGYQGTWNYEQTNGLGVVEFLNWCVDLGVEPVWAIWSGLWLSKQVVSKADLAPYVQDAMNELEFIMGDTSTTYGALRASLGYPEPWILKYIEVGNEDNVNSGQSTYQSYRLSMFYDAIKAVYPDMIIMSSTSNVEYAASAEDYHQYTRPDQFATEFGFFDNYPVSHPTLVGEYATIQYNDGNLAHGANWTSPKAPLPFWIGSVAEAIFTLGIERNQDKIIGASYAPMMQNMNSFEWTPDMIQFAADTSLTTYSTSYHVIQLLSNTRTTTVLPVKSDTAFNSTDVGMAYWVTGSNAESYIAKFAIYNTTGGADVPFSISFPTTSTTASLTYLTADDPYASNAFGGANVVQTTTVDLTAGGNGTFVFSLPQWSVAVLKTS
ncbi:hypothetical protein BP6252_07820 [Coleophoma cylindrospora]|uniref:non-reducing end alpha-L-arabinofuranosidase n=1 Tax=Coleophoma cylindrospora TaxID=1849047 RepID=A0A3D8RB31_9HELO|nr:hypothetical protein BP6252_07820 [Coleophoma cylindrospora]